MTIIQSMLGGSIAIAVTAASTTAFARPDSRSMSCQQTQDLLKRNGPTVLTTGASTYDRFVSRYGNACASNEVPSASYIQAKDTPSCSVYRCEPYNSLTDRRNR